MEKYSTGVVRNLDALGRIVIPKEVRQKFGIEERDPVEMLVEGEKISIKKYVPGCIFCCSLEALILIHNKHLCTSCANDVLNYYILGPGAKK